MLYYTESVRVILKNEPEFIFQENYLSSLKKMLDLSEQIAQETIDFVEAKLSFDSWFYQVTAEGYLVYEYNPELLVPISDAAKELGVSR